MWDLAVAPGESLPTHIHRLDFCFIVVQSGALQHVDSDTPENREDVQYHDDQVVCIEAQGGTIHHRLTKVDTTPYRTLIVELKHG